MRGKEHHKTLMERIGNYVIDRVLTVYGKSLTWFLNHRPISLIIWIATLVGTVWLLMNIPKSFLPIGDSSLAFGVLIAKQGASPEQMHTYQDQADKIIRADPAVHVSFTLTGLSQFLPPNQGFLIAFLYPPTQRLPIAAVTGMLMGKLHSVLNTLSVMTPQPVLQISTGATATQLGDNAYAVSGIDRDEVDLTAMKMMGAMSKFTYNGHMGFASIQPDLYNETPFLQIDILRDQASTYGISATAIENTLSQAYSQNYVYLIKKPEDQFQVILETSAQDRSLPMDLSLLYVRTDDGQRIVPLSAVAKWHEILGPQSVNHINQFASVTIYFNLPPDVPLSAATDYINKAAATIVPEGIRGSLQGKAKDFADTISSLAILMLLAVFVMYVVLGILYESYIHPITVLSSLPVALVGGLLTLFLFGEEASLYAYIGMFMLMGIVKKNGIMMIDFALQRMAQGQNSVDAIHDASMNRFRPIMMTTLAALMGALPIALGFGADGESRRPLGLVIVGGLIVSQFITLYITPVIYLYLEQFQERVLNRTSFFHSVRHVTADGVAIMGHDVNTGGNGAGAESPEAQLAAHK
jgi:hydrophobic/amphiphilic exporter-1 (mainly G- bacteria), HAE1 family